MDGPTNALLLRGYPLYKPGISQGSPDAVPYLDDGVRVYIDGGSYNMYTKNEKFTGVQSGPLRDSHGGTRWETGYNDWYTRSAVGANDCYLTVNNGHFTARCNTDGSVASDMGRRFLADLGVGEAKALQNLRINGGRFDGQAYSVFWYNFGNDTYDATPPILNGGTYTGGIQFCSTRRAFWKKLQGMYDLNGAMKDKKISELLVPGAVLYMDGKATDPDKTDLEDIAWPHEITIQPGPRITETRLLNKTLLAGRNTGFFVQYNQQPDRVELEEYVTVIRLGQEQSHWSPHDATDYILIPSLGTNYYNVTIPPQETAKTGTFRVAAVFGEVRVVSDPFEVEWVDTADFGFTHGPEVADSPEVSVVQVTFDFSHREALKQWGLWWSNGDHWTLIEDVNYLKPEYTPFDRYLVYISELADPNYEEMQYMISLEYDLGAEEPLEIESQPFTLTRDMLAGALPDPIGVGLFPGYCVIPEGGEQTVSVTLFPTVSPHKTGFTAASSDESVAEILSVGEEDFVIRGLKAGSATVTVTAAGGAATACEVTVQGGFLPGDVDGDGEITSTDARLVLQLAVNKITEGDLTVSAAADVDRDGFITSTDARLILQYSVGKITEWP